MTNKDMVTAVLWSYGCSTSNEIANLVHKDFGITITPSQCAGSLRPLIAAGKCSSSNCGLGKTKYWLNKDAANWSEAELKNVMWR